MEPSHPSLPEPSRRSPDQGLIAKSFGESSRPVVCRYDAQAIEAKWQAYWREHQTFRVSDPLPGEPKFYCLDMFPYPSGAGLHVGHPVGYIGSDIVARFMRMQGVKVLHPMGWDAFGLPAEQHAIKTGEHPTVTTERNAQNYRRQMDLLGLSFDWGRELSTTDPDYYRWTQHIFLEMYDAWFDPSQGRARPIAELSIPTEVAAAGEVAIQKFQAQHRLVYFDNVMVNWCPELGTVLANEEVFDGKTEQGYEVVRRPLPQVMMRISAYAERLLAGLEGLDWPESIKEIQRNWIGKTEGAEVVFRSADGAAVTVFTSRPDTLAGVSFVAIAPEHPLVEALVAPAHREQVLAYCAQASRKADVARLQGKEKTGEFTGCFLNHPLTGEQIPLYVADFVLVDHGTGAVMGVPAHDERDFDFAKKFGLAIRPVILPEGSADRDALLRGDKPWAGDGKHQQVAALSQIGLELGGQTSAEARERIVQHLAAHDLGCPKTRYRIRDWVFSRQRYWGDPIPLIHWEDGRVTAVPRSELPLKLPPLENFKPSGTGESALARARDWVEVYDQERALRGRREVNTMPQWAGSCWYPLRFMDPKNSLQLVAPEKEQAWGQVDLYVGGAEHATLHLLYARFWYHAMHDLGLIQTQEPFKKLVNQGLLVSHAFQDERGVIYPVDEIEARGEGFVHTASGRSVQKIVAKMSKSLRNVVNPDDVVREYGADSFRLFLMFMGPIDGPRSWNTEALSGARRFLGRVWSLVTANRPTGVRDTVADVDESQDVVFALNTMLQRVGEDFRAMKFNTAIAEYMKFVNAVGDAPLSALTLSKFVRALAPIAPHLAEELWERLGQTSSISTAPWPEADRSCLARQQSMVEVLLQLNGRRHERIEVPSDISDERIREVVGGVFERLTTPLGSDDRIHVVRDQRTGRVKLVNVVRR